MIYMACQSSFLEASHAFSNDLSCAQIEGGLQV